MRHAHFVGERTRRLRYQLLQATEQHQAQIEDLLGENAPLFRGSFGAARVCWRSSLSGCRLSDKNAPFLPHLSRFGARNPKRMGSCAQTPTSWMVGE